jgi:hypothetical protein
MAWPISWYQAELRDGSRQADFMGWMVLIPLALLPTRLGEVLVASLTGALSSETIKADITAMQSWYINMDDDGKETTCLPNVNR